MEQSGPISLQELVGIFHLQLNHPTMRTRNRAALREIVDRIAVVQEDSTGAGPRLVLLSHLPASGTSCIM
jgi:hypothetical protein